MQRLLRVCVLAIFAGTIAGCSSSGNGGASSSPSTTSTTTAPAPTTGVFSPSLAVAVPAFLSPSPTEEQPAFVTWTSPDGKTAARIMRPVVVYRPGATTASPVPADYVTYLTGQADDGAKLTDRSSTKVDGHAATVFNATAGRELDGSLGCPGTGIAAPDCFGLQPDLALRIAVVDTDAGPLLIWLRADASDTVNVKAERARLDEFLAGVRFAGRPR